MDKNYVIFDMDGTLVESMSYWRRLARDYAEGMGIVWTDEIAEAVGHSSVKRTAEYLIDNHGIKDSVDAILEACYRRMDQYYAEDVVIKDGVLEYLDHLRDQGVRMAVATATRRQSAMPALEQLDLLQYFEDVLCVSDIGISKQRPDIYLRLSEGWGQKPADVSVFEDAPYALKTVVRAGFHSVLMYDDVFAQEQLDVLDLPDLALQRMDQLLDPRDELIAAQSERDKLSPWVLLER